MLFVASAEPESLLDLIPGIHTWGSYLGTSWLGGAPVGVIHVVTTILAFILIALIVSRTFGKFSPHPDEKISARNFFEVILDAVMGFLEEQIGKEKARKYLPLIATIVFFIFFNNLFALIPGFGPATDNVNTHVGVALLVFFVSNIAGVVEHGFTGYFAEFFGPVRKWYALPLMILMFPIEVIGQLARPLSLTIRLMGNMFGDHTIVAVILMLFPFFLPIPFLLLGCLVVVLQTVIFSILSIVYISMAIAGHD